MVEQRKVAILAVCGLVAILCLTGWLGYAMRDQHSADMDSRKSRAASAAAPAPKAASKPIEYIMPSTDQAAADPTSWAMAAAVAHDRLYFGTDRDGVWYRGPAPGSDEPQDPNAWTQIDTASGLGENAVTAMAADPLGRLWVGHFSQGVSVFNGQRWAHYDPVSGPLGGHVYDIKPSPIDGDIWLATGSGLSRYHQATNTWQYITAAGAGGLPANSIRCLAFAKDGTLYVGTQSQGIAIARPADGYRQWTAIHAPGNRRMPLSASGEGLPSDVITSILVARDNAIYVATTAGLGISKDSGATWTFMRGRDWATLVKSLRGDPIPEDMTGAAPLSEDWCCTLTEDGAGRIWIGHRHSGNSVLDPATSQVRTCSTGSGGGGIRALVPLPGTADVLVATYGPDKGSAGGFRIAHLDNTPPTAGETQLAAATTPPLPADATAPTTQDLQALTQRITALPVRDPKAPAAGFLGEDWTTHGDWVGRYGESFAEVVSAPTSGAGRHSVGYRTGPHIKSGEDRTWHYSAESTGDDPLWLWSPTVASRCIGEINDGGWNDRLYPTTWDGPDLWVTFFLPKGVHRVAPFFIGGSSHDGHFRDYIVDLMTYSGDLAKDDANPPLASTRVTDYWHSLYTQFVIAKPGRYAIRVSRTQSHMAGINGFMIDRLDAPAAKGLAQRYAPPTCTEADLRGRDEAATARIAAAVALWQALDQAWDREGNFAMQKPYRLLAYRAAQAAGASEPLLANWRWKLCLWTDADRTAFQSAMQPAPNANTTGGEPATFP